MENNKLGFSLSLLSLTAVAFVTAGMMHVTTNYYVVTDVPDATAQEPNPKVDYNKDVMLTLTHSANTCVIRDSQYFSGTITVVYPDKVDEVVGKWLPDLYAIELRVPDGLDIGTVAHEVSHAVDTIMLTNPGVDPHYEAYLQGNLTDCVYQILQEDLDDKVVSKFKFKE